MTVKISIIFEGLASLLSSTRCLQDLFFCLRFQLFCSLLSLIFLYLLSCELIDIAVGQAVLANGSKEEFICLEQAAIFDDVLFSLGLRKRRLQVFCVFGVN